MPARFPEVQDSPFQLFLESFPDGFLAVDHNGIIAGVNAEAERLVRKPRADLLGQKFFDIFPDPGLRAKLTSAAAQRTSVETELFFQPWQVWFCIKASPTEGGLAIFIEDITSRVEVFQREREAREEAETLNEISRALAVELDTQKLVQLVTDRATKITGAKFGAFFYNVLNDRGEAFLLYTLSGAPRESFEKMGLPRNTAVFEPTFRGSSVVRSDDIQQDPRYGKVGPHYGMPAGHLPVRSYLAVPVIGRENTVLGGLFFGHPDPGVFTERAERLAVGIATHAAIAVDNARLLAAAEQSESRFRGVFQSSAIGVAILTPDAKFRLVNPAFCHITGYSEEELQSMDCPQLTHPDDCEATEDLVSSVIAGNIPSFSTEVRYFRKTGELVWVNSSVSLMRDVHRKPQYLIAVCQDITERKAAERAKNLLGAIVDSTDDAISSQDLNGIVTSWNKGAEHLMGYTSEEMIGTSVMRLVPEEHRDEAIDIMERVRRGESIDLYETVRRHKDGRMIDVSVMISPMRNSQGEIVGASRIARDITERRNAQRALQDSEARFRQLANSMPQMVFSTSADGFTDYYNQRWYEFTGDDRNVFGPISWEPLVHPDDLPVLHQGWMDAFRRGETFKYQLRLRDRKENRWRWFMGAAVPARDEHGNVVRWYGSTTDIDEQKRREEELRRANQDLEQFAFSASHDLQEPLRTIMIYSELLMFRHGDRFEGESREFLEFLRNAASRMELLVRDLLAYTQVSRIEAPHERTDAGEALAAALENLQGTVEEGGAQVSAGPLPSLPVDSTHLRQLFQNLVGNAVKYRSPHRIPEVRIEAQRRNESWVFSVKDNGIGISPEYKEHIFGLFKRLHSGAEYSGTGIGLAICQRIVERYNGRIWVESEPGEGSTFYFSLPV